MIPMKRGLPFGSLASVLLAAAIIGCGGSDGVNPNDSFQGEASTTGGSTGLGATTGTSGTTGTTTGGVIDPGASEPEVLAIDLTFFDAVGANANVTRITTPDQSNIGGLNTSGETPWLFIDIDEGNRNLSMNLEIQPEVGSFHDFSAPSDEPHGGDYNEYDYSEDGVTAMRDWDARGGGVRVLAVSDSEITLGFERVTFAPTGPIENSDNGARGTFSVSGTIRLRRIRYGTDDAWGRMNRLRTRAHSKGNA